MSSIEKTVVNCGMDRRQGRPSGDYSQGERLIKNMALLAGRLFCTYDELETELGVSRRTLQRDLGKLISLLIVKEGPSTERYAKTFSLCEGQRSPPLNVLLLEILLELEGVYENRLLFASR